MQEGPRLRLSPGLVPGAAGLGSLQSQAEPPPHLGLDVGTRASGWVAALPLGSALECVHACLFLGRKACLDSDKL